MIDELDRSLHPLLTKYIIEIVESLNVLSFEMFSPIAGLPYAGNNDRSTLGSRNRVNPVKSLEMTDTVTLTTETLHPRRVVSSPGSSARILALQFVFAILKQF